MLKIYCETNALLAEIKALAHQKQIELLHFPYDDWSSRQLRRATLAAESSEAQWRDLNISWNESREAWARFGDSPSPAHFEEIKAIIGPENRRDILHVHSAVKSGCDALVTRDTDITDHKAELEALLVPMRVFHADKDRDALLAFIGA